MEARPGGLRLVADASPKVDFPAEIDRRGEGAESIGGAGRLALNRLIDAGTCPGEVAVGGAAGGKLGIQAAADRSHQQARLFKAGRRRGQILVVGLRQGFQAVQPGVAKPFPPRATGLVSNRPGKLPKGGVCRIIVAEGLRERLGRQRVCPVIVGPHGAAGQAGRQDEGVDQH